MMAALRGRLPAMATLIARGAQVRRPGWTPLHYGASGQEPRAIDLLLAHGAEVDARSPNGSTPLMLAAGYGAIDGAVLLLRRGADPALRNQAGLTAADMARRADRDRLAEQLDAATR
jgi:ankyrin repeat protein